MWAVNVRGYDPVVPDAGVPDNTPVAALNATPEGREPVSANVGAGDPVAVTEKEPGTPTVKAVLLALLITGADVVFVLDDPHPATKRLAIMAPIMIN